MTLKEVVKDYEQENEELVNGDEQINILALFNVLSVYYEDELNLVFVAIVLAQIVVYVDVVENYSKDEGKSRRKK